MKIKKSKNKNHTSFHMKVLAQQKQHRYQQDVVSKYDCESTSKEKFEVISAV